MLSVAKLLGKKETCDGTTTQFEEVDQEWDHLKHTNSQAALLCSALLCSALLCSALPAKPLTPGLAGDSPDGDAVALGIPS